MTAHGSDRPLRVGVVGAGPWAQLVHAPMLARNPRTELAGIWARRPEAARALADEHGAPAFDVFDELCGACDALSFCVPPDVQAELAVRAARAGKALLLEKPLSLSLGQAQRLAHAVEEAGVVTQMVLTWRYSAAGRAFLGEVRRSEPLGGRGTFINGVLLGGMFATPWRLEHGPLLDLGPHVLDMLEACLGAITGLTARGRPLGWISLLVEHEGGALSAASLCSGVGLDRDVAGVEVYSSSGRHVFEGSSASVPTTLDNVVDEFVDATRTGRPHVLSAAHGLHLQGLLHDALVQLR